MMYSSELDHVNIYEYNEGLSMLKLIAFLKLYELYDLYKKVHNSKHLPSSLLLLTDSRTSYWVLPISWGDAQVKSNG